VLLFPRTQKFIPHHRTPRLLATLVTLTSGALLLGPAAGASPSPYPPDPNGPTRASGPMTHPELDWAGSTIPAHEGTSFNTRAVPAPAGIPGIDVSSHQGNVNWQAQWNNGKRFAYVKATEGTSYRNPYFSQQYVGSYNIGMIRGAYHFALPDRSSGAAQANFFASNGGAWSRDNKTLPGALDIEYNPYGATCYGLSQAAMRSWIADFLNTYHARTSRWATIYTTTDWWRTCTGNYSGFAANNPLWIARYASSVGTLPAGWGFYTFWQWTSSPLDQNVFNGSQARLLALANNTPL
jgi:GH25 family lysozyme M1 (1,4-beta-N-acetylmuramidase)